MGNAALLSLLTILISSQLLTAVCVALLWRRASRATPSEKAPTQWQAALAETRADLASLFSTFEKMNKTVMRLSSRAGMRDLRETTPTEPPPGSSKIEVMRFLGLNGKHGRDFAQRQLELERRPKDTKQ